MREHLQAIVTVLSLVNPVVCGAMFARIEASRVRGKQMADATNVSLAILVILALAALVGTRLLDLFGVSLSGLGCWTSSACPSMRSWWRVAAYWHGWASPC